jgi:AcrR family transcriptional regulator
MLSRMPRWEPEAQKRLRDAALDLYLERGYEQVTVAEITERAGLTRRTFSRYFTDKRDVLFAGSEQLPPALSDAIVNADASLSPFDALVRALIVVGEQLVERIAHAAQRRAIISASPELQERERTKFAAVGDALADALVQRGLSHPRAQLNAQVGVAIFQTAFARWTDAPQVDFAVWVHEATDELASALRTRAPAPS